MAERYDLICVIGPTAVGKTEFALTLAEELGGEIVNADSRQIYTGMDIGTAKPTPEETSRVPHHLIDVADPREAFSVGRFVELADAVIADIRARGRIPIVTGGTGLYVRALVDGLWDGPPIQPGLRDALGGIATARGKEALHRMLTRLDPDSAAVAHPNDEYKVTRALEITLATGRPASTLRREHGFPGRYRALMIALNRPRPELHERINRRVEQMLDRGWIEETRCLLDAGITPEHPGMNAVGYREVARLIGGEISREQAVDAICGATRRYAKRQFTWFRKDARITWLDSSGVSVRALVARAFKAHNLGVMRVDVTVCKTP